jgi:hypothetical protein
MPGSAGIAANFLTPRLRASQRAGTIYIALTPEERRRIYLEEKACIEQLDGVSATNSQPLAVEPRHRAE